MSDPAALFEKHVIHVVFESADRARTIIEMRDPTRPEFWFDVVILGPRILLTGDVGDLTIIRHGNRTVWDSVNWLRDCTGNLDYLAEKVSRDCRIREFDPEWATQRARDWIEGYYDLDDPEEKAECAAKLEEFEDDLPYDPHAAFQIHEVMADVMSSHDDPPELETFSRRFLVQVAALQAMARVYTETFGKETTS